MSNTKDFQDALLAEVNKLDLGMSARLDYFTPVGDDLVLNLMPEGQKVRGFMDGSAEVTLPFEIACKSLDNELASATLWKISAHLSEIEDIPSRDGSYDFIKLEVGREGFAGKDEQEHYVHLLHITAHIETHAKED